MPLILMRSPAISIVSPSIRGRTSPCQTSAMSTDTQERETLGAEFVDQLRGSKLGAVGIDGRDGQRADLPIGSGADVQSRRNPPVYSY
jgi:hypothetical protein